MNAVAKSSRADGAASSEADAGNHDRRPRVVMLVRNGFTHDSRVEKEARTLLSDGWAVAVVCEARPGLPLRELRDGVEIIRVPRPPLRVPFLRFLRYRSALVRALTAARPSVLHAHDANALDEVGTVARRQGIPFVYDSHELWLSRTRHKHSRLYHALVQRWHARTERRNVRRAAAVLTVSPPIAAHLERTYGLKHVELVPNYPELQPPATRDLRSLVGIDRIPPDAPIIIHIGLYVTDRGIEQLLEAVRSVPLVHVVLLGAGPRGPQATSLAARMGIADRVHPLAPVPPEDVVAFASSATIGVAPIIPNNLSYEYALPNKLFQYMAAGLPVVASDLAAMGAVVRDAGAGLTIDARNPAEIAAAVTSLLADPQRMTAMGMRGRRAVQERYHWGVAAEALVGTYRRLRTAVPAQAGGAGPR